MIYFSSLKRGKMIEYLNWLEFYSKSVDEYNNRVKAVNRLHMFSPTIKLFHLKSFIECTVDNELIILFYEEENSKTINDIFNCRVG